MISKVSKNIEERGELEIRAEERIALPTFVEPHVHLDKVLLAERVAEAKTIAEARQIVRETKKHFTVDDVTSRIERVLTWAITNGVTIVRTHVDVDSIVKLVSMEALSSLSEKYRDVVDLQLVAFPQEGVIQNEESLELLKEALRKDANVVGGLPEAERNTEDMKQHVDTVISLAEEFGRDVDVHCDVQPSTKNIEYYAAKAIERQFQGRCTADHLIALSYYSDEYAAKIISLIRQAEMNVVACPCTMMVSGALDPPPKGRGVTRIKEILAAGINLVYGLDNLVDPYNPFGNFNPFLNGWLLAYQGQLNSSQELDLLYRMPTYSSASLLRLSNYGLRPGCRADVNILNASNLREAFRTQTQPTYVIKKGRVIAENQTQTKLLL